MFSLFLFLFFFMFIILLCNNVFVIISVRIGYYVENKLSMLYIMRCGGGVFLFKVVGNSL